MHCDDNEGKMETGRLEPSARLERAACVVEQMGRRVARPRVPQSSSAVPALGAAGAGGEHLEFLCLPRRVLRDFSDGAWILSNCFPRGLCVVRLLCFSVLAPFQALKDASWRAAVRKCS